MTSWGIIRPQGSGAPAASAVSTHQHSSAAASGAAGSAALAPRRKSARTTASPGWSSSVAAGLYMCSPQVYW
jgi:hypothetical protein